MILAILMVLGRGFPAGGARVPVVEHRAAGRHGPGRRHVPRAPLCAVGAAAVLVLTDLILNVQMGYPAFYWPRV